MKFARRSYPEWLAEVHKELSTWKTCFYDGVGRPDLVCQQTKVFPAIGVTAEI